MQYVAFLRGIMPTNPNMKGEKLKAVFEGLGFSNVVTVIASGNVVFESSSKSASALEKKIEAALPEQLGFSSMTMVRSKDELLALAKRDPFKGIRDERPNYLVVTFFKDRRREVATVIDLSNSKATDYMAKIEKENGKALTTRTWKTVQRVLKKMES